MTASNETVIKGQLGKNLDDNFSPFIEAVFQAHKLPGLAIGVVAEVEVIYARGFGVKSIETQQPTTVETIFHMASVSKPFVATAIMQMVEREQVQLDAPVITYLPYFKLDDHRYSEITIQQMLSHVSGMPDEEDYEWDKPQYDNGAIERYVRSLSSKRLLSAPGEKCAYSNIAFECLGDVIAKVSGMPFDNYVKEHILDPAGMVESSFLKPKHLPENWAAPHLKVLTTLAWEGYPYNRRHGPSSTLHSNVLEMCSWAIANLNRGSLDGRQILNPSSYDLLWQPRAEIAPGEQVGLSWFLKAHRGERMVKHGGGDTGFRTFFALLPDKRAAAVVLCNLVPAPVEEIAHAALDVLLGYEPDPILPDAGSQVYKTLQETGVDTAVAQWDALKANYPNEYDFGSRQFYSLYNAIILDRLADAEALASLCASVLPESDVKGFRDAIKGYENRSAKAVLKVLGGH